MAHSKPQNPAYQHKRRNTVSAGGGTRTLCSYLITGPKRSLAAETHYGSSRQLSVTDGQMRPKCGHGAGPVCPRRGEATANQRSRLPANAGTPAGTAATGQTSNTLWMTKTPKPCGLRDQARRSCGHRGDRSCPMRTFARYLSHRTRPDGRPCMVSTPPRRC